MSATPSEFARLPIIVRWIAAVSGVASLGGAIWGFVRGLDTLRTLPFAMIEGAILIGVPGTFLGLLLGGVHQFLAFISARGTRRA